MTEVWLDDADLDWGEAEIYFHNAEIWARRCCTSFVSCTVQDVSDYSNQHDQVALYLFNDAADATMFRLRWS